jgi:hypothetical protein
LMQLSGAVLIAVERCGLNHMWMPAQDSPTAHDGAQIVIRRCCTDVQVALTWR